MLRRRLAAVVTLSAFACVTPPKAAPAPVAKEAAVQADEARVQAAAAEKQRAAKPEPSEKGPPDFAPYRAVMTRELIRLTHSREVNETRPEDAPDAKVPHAILVLKRIGQLDAYVVATVGFGRVPHSSKGTARVELLAYVEQYGPNIGRILNALGEYMHSRGPDAPPWHEYDVVALPKAELGFQYFDLRPGGQVDVSPDLSVTLLKVMPMSEDEFETAQKNASSEYDDPNSNARALQRWRQVVERR